MSFLEKLINFPPPLLSLKFTRLENDPVGSDGSAAAVASIDLIPARQSARNSHWALFPPINEPETDLH